jgi:hypothetical protein
LNVFEDLFQKKGKQSNVYLLRKRKHGNVYLEDLNERKDGNVYLNERKDGNVYLNERKDGNVYLNERKDGNVYLEDLNERKAR